MAWILQNIDSNEVIQLKKPKNKAGRSNGIEVICRSSNVSRNHAEFLILADGTLHIQDYNSSNGTFVNNVKIEPMKLVELKVNDEVGLGMCQLLDYKNTMSPPYYIFKVINENFNTNDTQDLIEILKEDTCAKIPKSEHDIKVETKENPVVLVPCEKIVKVENKACNQNYTMDDDIIVLSDEEGGDEYLCSQLFKMDNAVANPVVTENIFTSIKKELNEMDQLNGIPDPIPIDEDELEWEEGISAVKLHDILRNEIEPFNGTEKDYINELSKVSYHEFEIESPILEDENRNENLVEIKPSSSRLGPKKYSKPPIIPPHVESKKISLSKTITPTKTEKIQNVEKENNKKSPVKRKNSTKIETPAKRHKKTDTNSRTGSRSSTKLKISSPKVETKEKEHIKEMRNQKLKELASKQEKKVQSEKKSSTGTAKVKVSNGRGSFLLELGSPVENSKLDESSKSDDCKSTKLLEVKDVPFKPRVDPRIISRHKLKEALPPAQINNFDIITNILNWPTKWLEEQRHSKLPPPAVTQKKPVYMKSSFNSYDEYYDTVMPLLTLELWYSIYKDYDNYSQKNIREKCITVVIDSVKSQEDFENVECSYYTSKDEDTLMKEDLLLLQLPVIDKTRQSTSHMKVFGYVSQQHKTLQKNKSHGTKSNTSEKYKVYVNILVKKLNSTICIQRQCFIRHITSLTSSLRIFKSAKYLKYSQLCNFVLKPSIKAFQIGRVSRRKFVSKDKLNSSQEQAVMEATHICTRKEPGIYLIQGPPGTGKSTVITNIVQEILFGNGYNTDTCILLVAPSNAAIDELTVRLVKKVKPQLRTEQKRHMKLVRVGPKHVIHPDVVPYALHSIVARNLVIEFGSMPESSEITASMEKCKIEINNRKKKGLDTKELEKKLQDLMISVDQIIRRQKGHSYNNLYKQKEAIILSGANIICTTLSSCIRISIEELYKSFPHKKTCCIIDEATQSTEQETLIPLILGINKLVLVGDPQQLPATTMSMDAKKLGYGNSLFSRIESHLKKEKTNPIKMLTTQYRMHPEIVKYPNSAYYRNKLKNARDFKISGNLKNLNPYLVFNLNTLNIQNQAYCNDTEADCVAKLIVAIQKLVKNNCPYSIGVITPYNIQKEAIKSRLSKQKLDKICSVTVNTVDSFQGQEKDLIIISCVRFDSNSFLADDRRLNVAITRAKYGLYIIGTNHLFKTCMVLGKLISDADMRKLLFNINSSVTVDTLTNLIENINFK